MSIELFEQYRDMKISKDQFLNKLDGEQNFNITEKVVVSSQHVINLLLALKNGKITIEQLLDWVNTIWFKDWFKYNEEQEDCIASIMSELEELDEGHKVLSDEIISQYIFVLKNNIEL